MIEGVVLRWICRPANRIVAVAGLIVGILAQLMAPSLLLAATGFQQAYLRLDRMMISTTTGGLICAKPATTATEAKLLVTFPSTYTLDTTTAHWVTTTTNLPSGATAWPGIGSPTSVNNSTKVVTFPSNDLTVGTLYCFNFKDDGTNPAPVTTATSAADSQQGQIETQTSGSATIDSTQIALSNIGNDQITVTAVVPPSFAFSLSGNSDSLGTLSVSAGAVSSSSGITATVTTNAKGGWIAWAKDTDRSPGSQGLHSATANYTIPTAGTVDGAPSTLSGGPGGAEGYVLDVNTTDAAGGCTAATTAEYDGSGTTQGGTFSNIYQPISSCTGGSPGTANGDTFVLIERAAITGATPAATDYSDTITVVAAGNF